MKKTIAFIAFILLNVNMLMAQFTVQGTLADSLNNEKLMFVNVGLLRTADTVFVSGAASDENGHFIMNYVPQGQYILQITAIGYENYKKVIDVNADLNLGTIKMPVTE